MGWVEFGVTANPGEDADADADADERQSPGAWPIGLNQI
jgi:hypothetical protein